MKLMIRLMTRVLLMSSSSVNAAVGEASDDDIPFVIFVLVVVIVINRLFCVREERTARE